mgnify:CR=1 FL=1
MNTKSLWLCLALVAATSVSAATTHAIAPRANTKNDSILIAETAYTIATDRPSVGASAYTVPSGYLQYEGGYQFSLRRENQPFTEIYQAHSLDELLRFGVSDRFEIRLQVNGAAQRINQTTVVTPPYWQSGIYPVTGGFKYALLTEKGHRPQLSWLSQYSIPWVAAGDFLVPSGNLVLHEQRLLLAKSLGSRNSVGANVGFTGGLQGSASFVSDVLTTVSYTYTLGTLSLYAEYFATSTWGGNRWYSTQNIDGGFTALVGGGQTQIDVYMGWDLSPYFKPAAPTSGLFFGAGVSYALPVLQMKWR